MAETGKIVTAIDIGSSKIVTLVGEAGETEGDFAIVGVGIVPSRGMKRGQIVNVNEVTQAIRESVDGAERSSATKISAALVSMVGTTTNVWNVGGMPVEKSMRGSGLVVTSSVASQLTSATAIWLPASTPSRVIGSHVQSGTLKAIAWVSNPPANITVIRSTAPRYKNKA